MIKVKKTIGRKELYFWEYTEEELEQIRLEEEECRKQEQEYEEQKRLHPEDYVNPERPQDAQPEPIIENN